MRAEAMQSRGEHRRQFAPGVGPRRQWKNDEDQDKRRPPPPHSAAAAEADSRLEGAPAPERVPERDAHLRAGDRRPERSDAGVGVERRCGPQGRVRQGRAAAATSRAPRRLARRSPSDRSRRASSASCSTAAGSCITAAFAPWRTPRGKPVWSSSERDHARTQRTHRSGAARHQGHGGLDQPRHQGRQGRQEPELQRARRRRRRPRRRRLRRRQGEGSAVGDQEGHRGGEEEPDSRPAGRARRFRIRSSATSAPGACC